MRSPTRRTVREAGKGGGPWRPVAFMQEAVALQLSGTIADARPLLEIAEFETRGFAAAHAVTLAHLGLDALNRRKTRRAHCWCASGRGGRDVRAPGNETSAIVFAAEALAEARAGALEASRRASDHVEYLVDTLDRVHIRAQIHHHLILADAALVRGRERHCAPPLALRTGHRLPAEPDAVVLHQSAQQTHAERCASRNASTTIDLTPAEHLLLEQLATHWMLLRKIGDHLYVSRNTVKTHTMSIYRKLLASGRSEAVTRVIEFELLVTGDHDDRRAVAGKR